MKKLMSCIFLGLIISFSLLTGCGVNHVAGDVEDQISNVVQAEDEHVLAVKNGSPSNYPDQTFGEAFEKFFENPTWKYFKGTQEGTDDDGVGQPDSTETNVDVVEFTGYCIYSDTKVKALIQFTLDSENDTFQATYLSFNDVPQNSFVLAGLMTAVFAGDQNEEDTGTVSIEMSSESSTQPQYDSEAESIPINWEELYNRVLDEAKTDSTYSWHVNFDMDKDGIQELIVCEGTCEADYVCKVYTISENNAIEIGEFDGADIALYAPEDGSAGIISVYGHMGYEVVSTICKNGNAISSEINFEQEVPEDEDYYSTPYPIE